MSLKYSALCETDIRAYLAYCFSHGSGVIRARADDGTRDRHECGYGCIDTAASVDAFLRRNPCSGASKLAGVGVNGDCVCVCGSGGNRLLLEDAGTAGFRDNSVDSDGGNGAGGDNSFIQCAGTGNTDGISTTALLSDGIGENVQKLGDDVKASTLANRLKRQEKKRRKQRKQAEVLVGDAASVPEWRRKNVSGVKSLHHQGAFGDCSAEVKKELAETRAQRFIAENKASVRRAQAEAESWERAQKLKQVREEVQFEQAKQRLEVVKAVDVEKLKKKNEVKLMKETEVARVAVEKAFGTLAATGNAAGSFSSTSSYQSGTVKTVATDETSGVRSGTISPNSSISEAEVRKLQKDFLDIKKSNDEMVSAMRMLRTALNGDDFQSAKDIAARDYQAMYEESAGFTMDTDLAENRDDDDSGYIDKRGRFHFGIPPPVFEYDFDD